MIRYAAMDSLGSQSDPISDSGNGFWHPGGWIPVYDANLRLAGATSLKIEGEAAWLRKVVRNQSAIVGDVRRMLAEPDGGMPYWAYWVREGDPIDVPGFFAVESPRQAPFEAFLVRLAGVVRAPKAGLG